MVAIMGWAMDMDGGGAFVLSGSEMGGCMEGGVRPFLPPLELPWVSAEPPARGEATGAAKANGFCFGIFPWHEATDNRRKAANGWCDGVRR